MSSNDKPPVMAELPDDAIEALVQAAEHAYEYTPYDEMAEHAWPNVVRAVYPLIAARVRAEALREAAEKIAPNQARPSNVIVVGARMTDDVLDMVRTVEDTLAAAVRAEAVAAERQRIKALIDSLITKPLEWERDIYMRDGYRHVLDLLAAGSVPVAEKNPFLPAKPADGRHSFQGPADLGGNSRCKFCGAYQGSVEGQATCEGEFKQSGKMRAWAADRWRESLAVPVAAQLQPERVGFGTDAFETGGSLPGQPVATPTEPAGRHVCTETPCPVRHHAGVGRLCNVPGCDEDWCVGSREPSASPVPAEQPEER